MVKKTSLLFILFIAISAYSESNEILQIREIYKSAQEFQKANSDNSIQYVRYWNENTKDLSNWETLDKNSKKEDILSFIRIFKDHENVSSILLEESTPSGDWVHTTEYYFYDNSKIAFVFSNLSTFYGNVRVEKRFYFNESFKIIRELKSIYDLQTNKELKGRDNDFIDRKVVIVKDAVSVFEKLKLTFSR
ncbi:hypothetical protein V6Z05_14990 [Leptospira venezuelensis]|uniref:hypothetical protein n=1 Tax=Leptospira venezuelensis TaxID=1958811 RepID=UPI000A35D5E6|nr:hypothetical protein [Leptospira venezuelensis]